MGEGFEGLLRRVGVDTRLQRGVIQDPRKKAELSGRMQDHAESISRDAPRRCVDRGRNRRELLRNWSKGIELHRIAFHRLAIAQEIPEALGG